MKKHGLLIFGALLTAVLLGVSAISWPHLSNSIAVHFDLNGKPNGYMSKQTALIFGPAVVMGLTLLLAVVRKVRFSDEDAEGGQGKAFDLIGCAVIALIAASHILILLKAQGAVTNVTGVIVPLTALFLILMGNVLGKTRRNALVGIRTPWSLASPYAWEKSNRVGGRLFFLVGVMVLFVDFAFSSTLAIQALIAGVVATAAISILLSWHYWRSDPSRSAT